MPPETIDNVFGERLRERREAAGLTQDRLARRMAEAGYDTTSANISGWELGKNRPKSPGHVAALESILGCAGELTQALGWPMTDDARFAALEVRLSAVESALQSALDELRADRGES